MNGSARLARAGVASCVAGLLVAAITGCGAGSTALGASTLNSLLLPANDMPKGYTVDPSTTAFNGQALPADSPSPVPGSQACEILTETSWIRAAGFDTADFAQAGYLNSGHTAGINEEIDAFQGTNAQAAMSALWQAFDRCKNFSVTSQGVTGTMTLTRSTISGQPAGIKAVEVSPKYEGGSTLVAIRVGYAIVTVIASSAGSDDGSAAIAMAERIANRLSAAESGT